MTTPKLGRLRLANPNDAADIYELINESMMKNFRVYQIYDVNFMIKYSTIAIVQLDDKEEIVGCLVAKDHPNIPSVHPSAWEHYIWTKYKATEMTARNTLFIHLLCFDKTFGRDTVDSLLRSLFMHDSYLLYIAMVKSTLKYPLLMPGQNRTEASFKRIAAVDRGVPPDLLPSLSVAERSEVCPRLRVRRAVEEDNDDIVPIIDQQSTRLRELYGEFYISELISRHPESERVLLIAERAELAVAVMILNTVINYEALEENFDLTPFAGLQKLKRKPVSLLSQGSLQDASASAETFEGDAKKSESDKPQNPVVKADFKKTLNWFSNFLENSSATSIDVLVSMPMAIDEDDDVDFDIVNIEQDLLRIPRPLSVELNIVFDMSDETLHVSNVHIEEEAENEPPQPHRKKAVTANKYGPPEFVRYKGLSNAFLLEVFAMDPDVDERHGIDILQAAFEIYPDRDYCVLCLPSKSPAFPLLEHFTLVAPRGVREKYTNQSLYVAHKNSVLEHVAVRPAEAFDFPTISQILEHVSDKQNILQQLEKSLVSDVLYSYVLLSQQQPVGVVLLGRSGARIGQAEHTTSTGEIPSVQRIARLHAVKQQPVGVVLWGSLDNCVGIRTQYRLEPEPRSPGTDGAIIAGVLSPALEPHARFYLRDIIRRSKYYNLFWPCYMTSTAGFSSRNMMSLAGQMCPVTPHLNNVPNLTGIAELDKVWTAPAPFHLWMIDERLTALPKVDVNNGIVVVGASRTGLAFIETLLMGPPSQYLTFTNITLVSEYGLPMISDGLPAAETCVPRNGRFTERYLKSIPFLHYVDCIAGTMVGINRKLKCIHLRRGEVKYYDHLVLTCGQQFQHPDYLKESFAHSEKMRKGEPCKRILMDNPTYMPASVPPRPVLPENVFIINSLYEANICLRSLMSMIKARRESPDPLSPANPILVYGDYLESYSTMAALIELRISPRDIVFVEPFPPTDAHAMRVNCFNDELIDNRAQIRLKMLGIHVYRKCRYVSWTKLAGRIIAVQVMAPLHKISIPCFAFFYYGLKAVNYFAFKAICESGLVYDGGLVIDPMFKTNDPQVYGAGTIIQYSRKLRAEQKLHRDCCSEDVGEALGNIFLRQMDPFVMGVKKSDVSELLPRYRSSLLNILPHPSIESYTRPSLERNRKWQTVLEFDSPVTHSTVLPGPLYYMHVRAPGINLPMEVRLSLAQKGHTMMTDKDGNYFEIRLNEFHTICSITCLSKKPPCYEVLIQLYGVHEAMFNKLLSRYLLNKIPDFYEYFKQPWMSAMLHSSFGDMLREICRQNVGTIFDLVKSHFALDVRQDIDVEDDLDEWEKISRVISASTIHTLYSEMSSMIHGPVDAPRLGSVHSVIERFLKLGILYMEKEENKDLTTDECGISEFLQWDAMAFWNALSGDRIVTAHLARYLDRYFLPNPHYAKILPELI